MNQDLPLEIRDRLSDAAQDLYEAADNAAIHGTETQQRRTRLPQVL